MRIKEEFKKSGYFWLPSEPDEKLPGTLSISDGGHIELEVIGRFENRVEALLNAELKPRERIVGHIEKNECVTLDDCHYKTLPLSLMGGISKSLIHVGKVFTGVGYDEGESPVFNNLTFSVEGIDEWVGISGISVERHFEERTATISYQPPEDISINLDNGMQLLITFHWTLPGAPIIKEAKISQKTYFELVSKKERELKEFTSVARKITNFLCFAIDKTVSLDSMSATADIDLGEGQTRRVPVNIYYSSLPYSKNLFEKSFDTISHQVNGSNVHHSLNCLSREKGETNRTKKRCAPQSSAMGQPQTPIAQEVERFPIDTDASNITSRLILRDSQHQRRLTESLSAN